MCQFKNNGPDIMNSLTAVKKSLQQNSIEGIHRKATIIYLQ